MPRISSQPTPRYIPLQKETAPSSALSSNRADTTHFSGKTKSEVPTILKQKPTTQWGRIKAWFQDIYDNLMKWFNLKYVMNRAFGYFNKTQAKKVLSKLSKLTTEEARKIMNEPPLAKITYKPPVRLSTGISKASRHVGPESEIMKRYRDSTYLHILEDYGIEWSRFKVARDALQNFYDGQGQTLEGVAIDVKPAGSGKQKVKIKASATYDVDKLLALGGTGKKGQSATAGGFGEGAKMMALVMLRDYGINKVTFRSREWQADFTLAHPGSDEVPDGKTRGLMVKLTPLEPPIDGNELEFVTSDGSLAKTIQDGGKLFYNPKNPIFNNPTYENATGGFKLMTTADAKGRVYEAGQLRAFKKEGQYDAIPGLIVWSNKKLLDLKDRDRVAIQQHDVQTILGKIIADMPMDETAQGIQTLRKHWFYQNPDDLLNDDVNRGDDKKAAEMLLQILCEHYANLANEQSINLQENRPAFLPKGLLAIAPKDLAYDDSQKDQLKKLMQEGYIPVKPALEHLGIPNGQSLIVSQDALLEEKATRVTKPTARQQQQIDAMGNVLKEIAHSFTRQASSSSYYAYKGEQLAKLSALPIEIVSLPEQNAQDSFLKRSEDEKRILVEKRILENETFPEMMERLLALVNRETYVSDEDQRNWILSHLHDLQQYQSNWEKTDVR